MNSDRYEMARLRMRDERFCELVEWFEEVTDAHSWIIHGRPGEPHWNTAFNENSDYINELIPCFKKVMEI